MDKELQIILNNLPAEKLEEVIDYCELLLEAMSQDIMNNTNQDANSTR